MIILYGNLPFGHYLTWQIISDDAHVERILAAYQLEFGVIKRIKGPDHEEYYLLTRWENEHAD